MVGYFGPQGFTVGVFKIIGGGAGEAPANLPNKPNQAPIADLLKEKEVKSSVGPINEVGSNATVSNNTGYTDSSASVSNNAGYTDSQATVNNNTGDTESAATVSNNIEYKDSQATGTNNTGYTESSAPVSNNTEYKDSPAPELGLEPVQTGLDNMLLNEINSLDTSSAPVSILGLANLAAPLTLLVVLQATAEFRGRAADTPNTVQRDTERMYIN